MLDEATEIAAYFDRLWPLLRSLTGEGVRKTHDILAELVPLERIENSSGTTCFDWIIPKEWVAREAYVVDPHEDRIMDIQKNNLHLVNYSVPFRGKVSLEELDKNLHSLPEQPDAIPYVTSYYTPRWGFCLSHNQRQKLSSGMYDVVIDTGLVDGSMTISEAVLEGEEESEVLISTYTCHPSLANDGLSGMLVAAFLYRRLAELPQRRLSYRFVFLPETIGSITYLALRGEQLKKNMIAGYVITCVGDSAPFVYKRSRNGRTLADRAAEYVLEHASCSEVQIRDFFPWGSDERQYCSPGFDLPVGSIMRSMYATYPEYHTSLDNRSFISFEAMKESIDVYFEVCQVLEANRSYRNLIMQGEPQLGRRGLYPSLGAARSMENQVNALVWLLNLSDGTNDLLAIAERSGVDIASLDAAAENCLKAGLVEPIVVNAENGECRRRSDTSVGPGTVRLAGDSAERT